MLKVTRHENWLELFIPDMLDRIELLRLMEEYGVIRAWNDLHTEYSSGLAVIDPELWFVGLTSNPYIVAFADDMEQNDHGTELEVHGHVYSYVNYMTSDPVERLIVGDTVTLALVIQRENENLVFGRV